MFFYSGRPLNTVFRFLFPQPITHLIPAFYDHMELVDDNSMPFPPMDEDDEVEAFSRFSPAETGRTFIPQETSVIYSREIDSQASSKSTGEELVKNF